ncbi:MAG: ABC-ATPase domain-containing protein [Lachnospiraceae bacterium]|nr:ABC-ATPase domain-containing protein [Lachnospiraceae bacterium]
MQTSIDLKMKLRKIDHRGYPAYKELKGTYSFPGYTFSIEHVQGDPFAAPSSVSVHLSAKEAGFPADLLGDPEKPEAKKDAIALADHLLRGFAAELSRHSRQAKGSGKSGELSIAVPGQEVLERSACQFDGRGNLTVRFLIGFPAAGRTVLAGELEKILFDILPQCIKIRLTYASLSPEKLGAVRDLAEDQESLHLQMAERGLIGFVADGSVLPRESGISSKPLKGAVLFQSPEQDKVEFTLPHRGTITGMGIFPGVTLVIGGGYHGKSTLLDAIQAGVYNHIAGDGREFVMTDCTAVKVRAEDGRCVHGVDISQFIHDLPNRKDTGSFSTENASGSTSQAASVIEALESGSHVLIMDEDTCAANFMARDALMEMAVPDEGEPISAYCRKMHSLYEKCHVSTILVAGSSSAFFTEADRIIRMKEYIPLDVTEKIRELPGAQPEIGVPYRKDFSIPDFSKRRPLAKAGALEDRHGRLKKKNLGKDGFVLGHAETDLRALEQVPDRCQMEMLAAVTAALRSRMGGKTSLQKLVSDLIDKIEAEGFSAVSDGSIPGSLAMVRPQDVFAAVNRCRWIQD